MVIFSEGLTQNAGHKGLSNMTSLNCAMRSASVQSTKDMQAFVSSRNIPITLCKDEFLVTKPTGRWPTRSKWSQLSIHTWWHFSQKTTEKLHPNLWCRWVVVNSHKSSLVMMTSHMTSFKQRSFQMSYFISTSK